HHRPAVRITAPLACGVRPCHTRRGEGRPCGFPGPGHGHGRALRPFHGRRVPVGDRLREPRRGPATMPEASQPTLPELLEAAGDGDERALDLVFARVYDELKGLAHRVRGGRASETLDTTALVHEAYLKLLPSAAIEWKGRAHFFAVAARAMRQILADAARRRLAAKRGGGALCSVTYDDD